MIHTVQVRKTLLITAWIVCDLLLFLGCYVLAYFFRVGFIVSSDFPLTPYLGVVVLVSPLWLSVLTVTKTFSVMRDQTSLRNFLYIVYASLVGAAFFALAYYFIYGLFFSRALLLIAFSLSGIGAWIWHCIFMRIARHILRNNPPAFPTLIVGVTRESRALIRQLNKRKHPLLPVAILTNEAIGERTIEGVPVEGRLHKFEETLRTFRITHLIQASDLEQSLNLLSACRKEKITYILLPSVLGIVDRQAHAETSIEGIPVVTVSSSSGPLHWLFH